jgi:hypothetical protein
MSFSPNRELRRHRRFTLELPVSVIRHGTLRVVFRGQTKNISSSGVLFVTDRRPSPGVPIEYLVTLWQSSAGAVSLRCMGKVLRSKPLSPVAYQLAATLERYEFVRE